MKSFIVSFFNKSFFKSFLFILFMLVTNCKSIELNGQFVDNNTIKEIKSRKLSQEKVIELIGTPTYIPDYSHNTWYYIQRYLVKRAWFKPTVVEQRIVKISFTEDKKVLNAFLLQNTHNEDFKVESKYTKPQFKQDSAIQKFIKNMRKFNSDKRKRWEQENE